GVALPNRRTAPDGRLRGRARGARMGPVPAVRREPRPLRAAARRHRPPGAGPARRQARGPSGRARRRASLPRALGPLPGPVVLGTHRGVRALRVRHGLPLGSGGPARPALLRPGGARGDGSGLPSPPARSQGVPAHAGPAALLPRRLPRGRRGRRRAVRRGRDGPLLGLLARLPARGRGRAGGGRRPLLSARRRRPRRAATGPAARRPRDAPALRVLRRRAAGPRRRAVLHAVARPQALGPAGAARPRRFSVPRRRTPGAGARPVRGGGGPPDRAGARAPRRALRGGPAGGGGPRLASRPLPRARLRAHAAARRDRRPHGQASGRLAPAPGRQPSPRTL
ncbi:MAG: Beta-carotene 15,15'-dioxygenase, partial [uncultured Rubrobacteraceae bacterium]